MQVTRIALGGYPFGGVNKARGWDPFGTEGRATAIQTIHAALDNGINLIDTAPSYGNGNSESLIGEATFGRRSEFFLATKVGWKGGADEVVASVEDSLRRLRTDAVDILQLHGGRFTGENVHHIIHQGPAEALAALREQGKARFLGFTVEEPWTARELIAAGIFDVMQVRYNLIHQGAALHALDQATAADMGVSVMRPMTSGIFQRLASYIAPAWNDSHDLFEVALKFVLSDSRVHTANLGMRWQAEVEKNVALAEGFVPPFDVACLPRLTAEVYRTDDESPVGQ